MDPASIGHIHAHGLGTQQCDQQEAEAIVDVFGDAKNQPPVTTVKGHIGNLGAGSGMVEIVASLESLGGSVVSNFELRPVGRGLSDPRVFRRQHSGRRFVCQFERHCRAGVGRADATLRSVKLGDVNSLAGEVQTRGNSVRC